MSAPRRVDPHIADLMEDGALELADGVDPASLVYVQVPGQPNTLPACMLDPQYAQYLADTDTPPPPDYVHCGRDCARCDLVFPAS